MWTVLRHWHYAGLRSACSSSWACWHVTGIYFDADLSMRCHVQKTVASCFAVLRQLRSIRWSVPTSVYPSSVVAIMHISYTLFTNFVRCCCLTSFSSSLSHALPRPRWNCLVHITDKISSSLWRHHLTDKQNLYHFQSNVALAWLQESSITDQQTQYHLETTRNSETKVRLKYSTPQLETVKSKKE